MFSKQKKDESGSLWFLRVHFCRQDLAGLLLTYVHFVSLNWNVDTVHEI